MSQSVAIKGTKSGIILVLDENLPYSELKKTIAEKFSEASGFLGKNKMGLIIRGRSLSDGQQQEVVDIINDVTELTITCIIDEESETEKLFEAKKAVEKAQESSVSFTNETADNSDMAQAIVTECENNAQIFKGNLRSGQDVSCEQSVIILGDVKPGGSVTSFGSIFILGELRGNAFAGAGGDRNAIVMALKLDPLQVRIADAIAISPDAEKGPKLRFKKKKIMSNENEPEVAYIDNGHIVKTLYGASFLRQLNK